jgi:ABC-2 type transport system permease protein
MLKKLLDIEATKTLYNPTFRTLILLHFILFLLVAFVASSFKLNIQGVTVEKVFHFPYVWNTLAWIASWFNLLLGILAIVLVANEFQFRTFRKHLIDGLTRNEILVSKVIVFTLLAFYTMLLVFLMGLIFGMIKSPSFNIHSFIEGLPFLPILFIQSLGYMLLAMLFAFLIRSTGLSIVAFVLYFFPVEPIIRFFVPEIAIQYLPVKTIANLTPMPDFVGISLSDTIILPGSDSAAGLYSMGILSKPLPFIISASVTVIYCLIFVFASKLVVRVKNF